MKSTIHISKGITLASILFCFISLNKVFCQDPAPVKPDTAAVQLSLLVQLTTGHLDSLKSAKIVNIEFRNDTTKVGKMTETDYINKKVKELNEKESGKGDQWLVTWKENRSLGETWMVDYLNKSLTKAKLTFQKGSLNAKYTMVVNSYAIEEGWDVFFETYPSVAGLSLALVETQNRDIEMATLKCAGMGAPGKLYGAYADAGKRLGKAIYKQLYPK